MRMDDGRREAGRGWSIQASKQAPNTQTGRQPAAAAAGRETGSEFLDRSSAYFPYWYARVHEKA